MTTTQQTFTGWCCTDCLMILANGEDNPEWSEAEATAHHAAMARQCEGCEITLGLSADQHDQDCPNIRPAREIATMVVSTGQHYVVPAEWLGRSDCWCEHDEFSWSSCDTCGSSLGGARDAVTFWINKEES